MVVDELSDVERLLGIPESRKIRYSIIKSKSSCKRTCKGKWKKYEDLKLVVTHMGGGVSVGVINMEKSSLNKSRWRIPSTRKSRRSTGWRTY